MYKYEQSGICRTFSTHFGTLQKQLETISYAIHLPRHSQHSELILNLTCGKHNVDGAENGTHQNQLHRTTDIENVNV